MRIMEVLDGLLADADWTKRAELPFTIGMPRVKRTRVGADNEIRLVYWRDGILARRRVGIASSRLPRPWHKYPHWFETLRGIVQSLSADECLFSVAGTSCEPFVRRCPELFGKSALILHLSHSNPLETDWQMALRSWWKKIQRRSTVVNECCEAFASPPITLRDLGALLHRHGEELLPLRDEVLAAWSERIEVVQLRRHGVWDQLLRRTMVSDWASTSMEPYMPFLRIPGDERNIPPDLRAEFERLGAVVRSTTMATAAAKNASPSGISDLPECDPVHLQPAGTHVPPGTNVPPGKLVQVELRPSTALSGIRFSSLPESGAYLTHWTRAPRGGWPDEPRSAYLDRLLLGEPIEADSACDSLLRIIRTRRICGSNRGIRGGHSMVCLTAVPLEQWSRRRVYRRHRTRFDFEPYGICLRRKWIEDRGGRSVIYGTDRDWRSLPSDQQPFFQKACTTNCSTLDWMEEREWRFRGELDLRDCTAADAWVFAATQEDVERLQAVSPWPVIGLWQLG